ncbi:MAG: putative aminoglycoside phosphotransferase [Frankiales bacterium]|nr:putative aminoglycoside phosphotransferase [Frankiales bacterium]
MTSTDLSPELWAWVGETAGGELVEAERRPGGGRNEAWLVAVKLPGGEILPLFLRYNRSATRDAFTIRREAQFFLALQGTDVPVPRIYGVHPSEQAVLASRVSGETWFSRLTDEDLRVQVARDFMSKLAALHALDPHRLHLEGQDADAPLPVLVERELDAWEELYHQGGDPDPLLEFALVWLRHHRPAAEGPVVIVQGDTGPGNFLYEDGRVTAVLDWELAHLGDPHDDLGWLALRATQEPFTVLAERFDDYAALTGLDIDPERVRYYRAFAHFRVAVLGHRRTEDNDLLGEVGNGMIYGYLHRRLLVEALADSMSVPPSAPPGLTAESTPHGWYYDAALAQLSHVIVPRSTDPFVILRSKGLARILKHLQQVDRYGAAAEEQQIDDLVQLLGHPVTSAAEGSADLVKALATGTVAEEAALQYFGRQVARETFLARPAMGALADRHHDPLPR